MRPLSKIGLAVIAAGFAVTMPLQGQVRALLGGGASVPVGDFADDNLGAAQAGGMHGLVGAEWSPVERNFGIRVDGSYQRFCTASCDAAGGSQDIKYRFWNANLSGIVELPLNPDSPVRPYLVAGGGIYNHGLQGNDVPLGSRDSKTDFGISGGLGVNFAFQGVGLFVEGRFHNVFAEGYDLQYIPIMVGVRLGGQ